jgi:hypothetical protein
MTMSILWEVHPAQQLPKARLAAQAGEIRDHIDQGHIGIARIVSVVRQNSIQLLLLSP